MKAQEQIEAIEGLRKLHDGDKTFVAESVVFSSDSDSRIFGSLCNLVIKDIKGREFTVVLPFGFTEKLISEGYNSLVNKTPQIKTEKDFLKFAKKFRLYINSGASDEFIRDIYFSEHSRLLVIFSYLSITDKLADFDLSVDILGDE